MRHLDDFVPANHPLRPIRVMVNAALVKMDALLSGMALLHKPELGRYNFSPRRSYAMTSLWPLGFTHASSLAQLG